MLEHQKIILKNVSDNKQLFKKELIKSMIWLSSNELIQLRKWLREQFWESHADEINEVLYLSCIEI